MYDITENEWRTADNLHLYREQKPNQWLCLSHKSSRLNVIK